MTITNADLERIILRNKRRVEICQDESLRWRRLSDIANEKMREAQAELMRNKSWLPPVDDA